MPDKKCPKCGLWNTEGAIRCDCGYFFDAKYQQQISQQEGTPQKQGRWLQVKAIIEVLFKAGYAIMVIFGLGYIFLGLIMSMGSAQSAMQASQLYNEATTEILGIIALTLLVIFLRL